LNLLGPKKLTSFLQEEQQGQQQDEIRLICLFIDIKIPSLINTVKHQRNLYRTYTNPIGAASLWKTLQRPGLCRAGGGGWQYLY